jgi:transposase
MATTRLPMRHLRESFRQKFELGLAHRAIAQSVGVSLGAVATALSRARTRGLDWAQVQALADRPVRAPRTSVSRARLSTPGRFSVSASWITSSRRQAGISAHLPRQDC